MIAVRALALLLVAGCGGGSSSNADMAASTCALAQNTTASATVTNGCARLVRDTSSCRAARTAAGLSGWWLEFSCRVTLTKATDAQVKFDGQPDYRSNYFANKDDPCYTSMTGGITNPNRIAAQNVTMTVPASPTVTDQDMRGAIVGVALNGVPIFSNFAAPGDDIFQEALTFDACGGHPQMTGVYHYHSEPYAISSDDANFIGVLRDGYPLYGRRDMDGSLPTLDAAGGHTGATPHGTVYHHHVNQQTSTNPRTGGEKQWFLTTGKYHGAPGACTGC